MNDEKPIMLEAIDSDGPVDLHIGDDRNLYLFLWIPTQTIIKVPLSDSQYTAVKAAIRRKS